MRVREKTINQLVRQYGGRGSSKELKDFLAALKANFKKNKRITEKKAIIFISEKKVIGVFNDFLDREYTPRHKDAFIYLLKQLHYVYPGNAFDAYRSLKTEKFSLMVEGNNLLRASKTPFQVASFLVFLKRHNIVIETDVVQAENPEAYIDTSAYKNMVKLHVHLHSYFSEIEKIFNTLSMRGRLNTLFFSKDNAQGTFDSLLEDSSSLNELMLLLSYPSTTWKFELELTPENIQKMIAYKHLALLHQLIKVLVNFAGKPFLLGANGTGGVANSVIEEIVLISDDKRNSLGKILELDSFKNPQPYQYADLFTLLRFLRKEKIFTSGLISEIDNVIKYKVSVRWPEISLEQYSELCKKNTLTQESFNLLIEIYKLEENIKHLKEQEVGDKNEVVYEERKMKVSQLLLKPYLEGKIHLTIKALFDRHMKDVESRKGKYPNIFDYMGSCIFDDMGSLQEKTEEGKNAEICLEEMRLTRNIGHPLRRKYVSPKKEVWVWVGRRRKPMSPLSLLEIVWEIAHNDRYRKGKLEDAIQQIITGLNKIHSSYEEWKMGPDNDECYPTHGGATVMLLETLSGFYKYEQKSKHEVNIGALVKVGLMGSEKRDQETESFSDEDDNFVDTALKQLSEVSL